MKIKLLIYSVILLLTKNVYSQLDTIFWFAAPAISGTCGSAPVNLILTNPNNYPAFVTVSAPAAGSLYAPTNHTIQPKKTIKVALWSEACNVMDIANRTALENRPTGGNIGPFPNGLQVHVTNRLPIKAQYEVGGTTNAEMFTLKGKNALGSEFYCLFQNLSANNPFPNPQKAFSSVNIVATQDNTRLTIDPNGKEILGLSNGVGTFTIDLDRGESIALIPGPNGSTNPDNAYQTPITRLNGVKIEATIGPAGPPAQVAVTLCDDAVFGSADGTAPSNIIGDQIYPLNKVVDDAIDYSLAGTAFFIPRGEPIGDVSSDGVTAEDTYDQFYVVATEDNTIVTFQDVTTGTFAFPQVVTLQEGEVYRFQLTSQVNSDLAYIKSDGGKRIYVLHTTSSKSGNRLGGTYPPPMRNCIGSSIVEFSRGNNPGSTKELSLMILFRELSNNDAENVRNKFNIEWTPGIGLPETNDLPGNFTKIGNTKWWFNRISSYSHAGAAFLKLIKSHAYNKIWNENKNVVFHVFLMDGDANSNQYTFLSNFGPIENFGTIIKTNSGRADICLGDTVQLHTRANFFTEYEWMPQEYLNFNTISEPVSIPRQNIVYKPNAIHSTCLTEDDDSLIVTVGDSISAHFEMDKSWACAPDSVVVTNLSLQAPQYSWYVDDIFYSNQRLPQFKLYLNNLSDTIVKKKISLTTQSELCIRSMTRYVDMLPEIHTGFETNVISGCHPLEISFTDTTIGNSDTTQYFWDFGDDESSELVNPVHTFNNFSSNDTTYRVKLLTLSPFACPDSAFLDINVYPYILADFTMDSTQSCSPLIVDLNPDFSIGADTFIWNLYDSKFRFDTLIEKETGETITYSHSDFTQDAPDTIRVELITKNRFNCADTTHTRELVAFPVVQSDFEPDSYQVCDSVEVTFTNLSTISPMITYNWSFGDQKILVTDSVSDVYNTYFNRTTATKPYEITLISYNTFSCSDTIRKSIDVHPYVNAEFNFERPDNCSPAQTLINNHSLGTDGNMWYFGDGNSQLNNAGSFNYLYSNPNQDRDTTFILKLVTWNNEGCFDSVSHPVLLHPVMATNFDIVTPFQGCNPLTVGLINTSVGLPDANYTWNFDNGNVSGYDGRDTFYISFDHRDAVTKVFDISLHGSDYYGCDSTLSKPVEVYSFVEALININNIDSCSPFKPIIKNSSSPGTTPAWDYGDHYVMSRARYENTGDVSVVDTLILTATNPQGCYDKDTVLVTIHPQTFVRLNALQVEGCEPFNAKFFNNSDQLDGSIYTWTFGDGFTQLDSTRSSINHTYQNNTTSEKIFIVKLHELTEHGCQGEDQLDIKVFPKVQAGFYTDKNAVCYHDPVRFTNTSSGAKQYEWYNGNVLISQSPTSFNFTFSESDVTKNISLIAIYENKCRDTVVHELILHPRIEPEIIFQGGNNGGCHPFDAKFSGNIEPNDQTYYYEWNYGKSGTTETGVVSATRMYFNTENSLKNYPLSLFVRNMVSGCTGYDSTNLSVFPNPEADFTLNSPLNICAPYQVSFTNTSKPALGVTNTYYWDFDDGSNMTTTEPGDVSHIYTNTTINTLNRNFELLVETSDGCRDSISETFTVYPEIDAEFEINPDTASCSPLSVQIASTATRNATNFRWDMGDGTIVTTKNPNYTYFNRSDTTQVRTISLIASSDFLCSDTISHEVVIYAQPEAFFYTTPVSQFYPASTVTISNLTKFSDSWNYEWDFDDGFYSNEIQPVHKYNYWGDFKIKARVFTDYCESIAIKSANIHPGKPKAGFESISEGCEPLEVTFRDTSIYGHTHIWSFDDLGDSLYSGPGDDSLKQIVPFGEEITHVFDSAGEYNISLRIEGDGGTDIFYKVIIVHPLPEIDFEVSPDLVMLPNESIKGFNRTLGAVEYHWDFGDGNTSTEFEPLHLYKNPGDFTITLTATSDKGCVISKADDSGVQVEDVGVIKFPNAFIPSTTGPGGGSFNEDLENGDVTVFYPITDGVQTYHLEIYDKWGELLFVSDDLKIGWDGYFEGKLAPQSVYIWNVSGTYINGVSFQFVGNVTLLHGNP